MGEATKAKCLDCGTSFSVHHGGGFAFHLLRCDTCGVTKSVNFNELGELHLRYLKGLAGPYCVASEEYDEHVRKHVTVESISEEKYHSGIEASAGNCQCGGKFKFTAPPRCPKCRSMRVEEGGPTIMYD